MPKTEDELHQTAELWCKIGYRDRLVSNDEIQCSGCTINNWCRYKIVECTERHKIENCGQCPNYPCGKIKDAFEQTLLFEPSCKLQCSVEEYDIIKRSFFEKEKNLDEIACRIK